MTLVSISLTEETFQQDGKMRCQGDQEGKGSKQEEVS